MSKHLILNLFIYPGGHHEAAWRHPNSATDRITEIEFYQDLARRAEAAKFDSLFFADGPSLADNIQYASRFRLEPLTWLSAIAAVTRRIGLIATASTTYSEPYNLARLFGSLDHISHGRAGWNIVTTGQPQAAQNFGLAEHPVHADRYERAREYLDVITRLWDSWEDDALVADKASGVYADPAKIHAINHIGKHFKVRGPLNFPRTPQGRPVYVQAGSSEDGRSFAAQYAEAIFTAHQTLKSAQDFYTDIKRRATSLGRDPSQIKILPGISPFIGATEAEALRLKEEFDDLTQTPYSLDLLKRLLGQDFSGYDLDGPFPREKLQLTGDRAAASRSNLVLDLIDRENLTIRQVMHRLAAARGHWIVAGTPDKIADAIQHWFENDAADGFNIMPPWLPGGFEDFADHVLPILKARGLFRADYEGATLRQHYGLERPESQYAHPLRLSV
ncbi:MAG TPA: LLM class flavin-dependent oxidoreductase [Rhizomicrobium sp.]|jgi:FMN-dependent oxidoreductase (nitrilotriacetate monooxygenase family)